MKLGLVSAILEHMEFEEMIDFLSVNGFNCVEVACWPQGGKTRKYGGVSHIDVTNLSDEKISQLKKYAAEKNVEISALAYYPNVMSHDIEQRESAIQHLKQVINAAAKMGVPYVTTFIGRNQKETIEANFELLPEIWNPIIELAEDLDVKIAIENCPMLFTKDEWPGGQNLMTSPRNWEKVFEILKSPNLGLNFDPSHFVWQQMDYIKPLEKFKDKLFYVHFKDIKLFKDKLDNVGVMAYPLEYMDPKLPGDGDVNWESFIAELKKIGYNGFTSIEIEDRAHEDSIESVNNSVVITQKYISERLGK